MTQRKPLESGYTVSGPGVDETRGSEHLALVVAQGHAVRQQVESTYYVRDPEGTALYQVERTQDGEVLTSQVAR